MENDKPNTECYQRILMVVAWIFFAVAIILVILSFFHVVHSLLFAPFYMAYHLLNRLAAWKQNPKREMIGIVFDTVLLLVTIVVLILDILY